MIFSLMEISRPCYCLSEIT